MEEREYVTHLILEWADARNAANENTTLMRESNFSAPVMEECAKRMKRLHYCETELMGLYHSIPQVLQNFIDARMDKGCPRCWLSSSTYVEHTECLAYL